MRSLRVSFHSCSLRHRRASYSEFKVPVRQPGPTSYTIENIKQTATPSLLGMLWDHHLYPQCKHLLFKESYNRVPNLHQSDILKLLKLFMSSSVPTQICVKLAQVLVMRENLSQAHYLEILKILFGKTDTIYPYGNVIRLTLKRIDENQICNDFLLEMWVKSIDRYSSTQLYSIIWLLTKILMNRLRGFSDDQIFDILKLNRSVKRSSVHLLQSIHSDVISHRPKNFVLMGMILSSYLTRLEFDSEINQAYSQKIVECLKSGEVPPTAIGLAGTLARLNYIKPGLYQALEPFATRHLQNGKLSDHDMNSYLFGSAIADFFPKKFIRTFAVPDRLRSLIRELKGKPFLKSVLDICSVINYATSKGIDLELSQEVREIMEEFTFLFSTVSWQFQQSVVNPWENRANSSLATIFPLYANWPTCNGYIIDACLFFDKEGNPMSLSNKVDFLVYSDKMFQGYFDKFGLDNTKVRSDSMNFRHIWNVMKSPDILKGVHTKFAIEFNGPHHFLKADDEYLRIDGPTMLRRKFLQANGWEYIGVPFTLFERIPNLTNFQYIMQNLIEHVLKFRTNH